MMKMKFAINMQIPIFNSVSSAKEFLNLYWQFKMFIILVKEITKMLLKLGFIKFA
jgi:hypothetical protein